MVWRFPRLLITGLAAFVAATGGLCTLLAACSDDLASADSASDAGLIDSAPVDTGAPDHDSGFTGSNPRLTLVNAAHDLGSHVSVGVSGASTSPFRLCFKVGSLAE